MFITKLICTSSCSTILAKFRMGSLKATISIGAQNGERLAETMADEGGERHVGTATGERGPGDRQQGLRARTTWRQAGRGIECGPEVW